jgi:ubiquinone/menaquinone biosynthesis C-methylase UbiE
MNVFTKDNIARDYDNYYLTAPGMEIDRLEKKIMLQLIEKLPRQPMLELGCGTGHWSEFFAGLGFSVKASDISDAMLALARAKKINNVVFEKTDVLHLPYPDSSFGIVASITMLEFTGNIPLALSEMSRVLKPGGWLVLGCLNADSVLGKMKEADEVFRSAQFLNQTDLYEMLSAIGSPVIRQCVHLTDSFELLDGTERQSSVEGTFLAALLQKSPVV